MDKHNLGTILTTSVGQRVRTIGMYPPRSAIDLERRVVTLGGQGVTFEYSFDRYLKETSEVLTDCGVSVLSVVRHLRKRICLEDAIGSTTYSEIGSEPLTVVNGGMTMRTVFSVLLIRSLSRRSSLCLQNKMQLSPL